MVKHKKKNNKLALPGSNDATSAENKKSDVWNKITTIFGVLLFVIGLPVFINWGANKLVDWLESEDVQSLVNEPKKWSIETVPNTRLQSDYIHVSDPDNIIEDVYEDSINSVLSSIREKSDIFIVALNRIDNESGDMFTNELFNHWGIGEKGKDNGVLVLMTMEPHFIRIETGYGMEEILPDVVCHRIIRDNVKPDFKQDRYGEGMLKCAQSLAYVVAGIEYDGIEKVTVNTLAQQLDGDVTSTSGESADYEEDITWGEFFLALLTLWYFFSFLFSPFYSLYHLYKLYKIRKHYKEEKHNDENLAYGIASRDAFSNKKQVWLCLLFPLCVVTAIWFMVIGFYFRRKKRICPECSNRMRRLSEEEEDPYLTELQILEENEKIKDYDVWVCECGKTFVDFYEGSEYSSYVDCPRCGVHMSKVVSRETIVSPTYTEKGKEKVYYECKHCGHTHYGFKDIPKLTRSSGGGGGYGSSGGGGSFGGGHSGGGGSSSSW